jgi:polar amino acid transport system ATP-binding protein
MFYLTGYDTSGYVFFQCAVLPLDGEITLLTRRPDVAQEGMTMILVTHEMNFAKNVADRVIFMHEGRIHEDGPARETLVEPRTAELRSFLSAVLH